MLRIILHRRSCKVDVEYEMKGKLSRGGFIKDYKES
jgi:hypothetical protein